MRHPLIRGLMLLTGLVLLGAACTAKKTTVNTSPIPTTTINVNDVPTNSKTTGAFTTVTNAAVSSRVITLSATGIDPKSLTVAVGTTVTFTNNDSVAHHIASNPHPAHTGLPGFDSLVGVSTGETYTYRFVQAGTFGYHDHLDATNTKFQGTVVVQ